MCNNIPVIAVDGPGGVGKGTLCRALAAQFGWHFLDSGALYRLTALAALQRHLPLDDEVQVSALARNLDVHFSNAADDERIFLVDNDVSELIRSERCGNAASIVAAIPAVRNALLQRQRDFRQLPGLVADGRDMGTVVFPDAPVKIFLTANPEACAIRRHNQLKEKGIDVSLADLVDEIAERNQRDSQRSVAPLRPAADAHVLDTSELGIAQVKECAVGLVNRQLKFRDVAADPAIR
ncbi:MAG: (d)CMP kinase [Candidatus Competibacteraceae bacterium]|jgi:cytidylate kinase|nr:(d)CMP kinase [Candidatus Competibacteraceae bacterium]